MTKLKNTFNLGSEKLGESVDRVQKKDVQQSYLSDFFDIQQNDSLVSAVANQIGSGLASLSGDTLENGESSALEAFATLEGEGIPLDILSDFPTSFTTQTEMNYDMSVYRDRYKTISETRQRYGVMGNIVMDIGADLLLAAPAKLTKLTQAVGSANRLLKGANNSTLRKVAADTITGASLGLGYEFSLDVLQKGYEGDYYNAAGFGAGGGAVFSGLGSAFGMIGKNSFKRNQKVDYSNEDSGNAADLMDESEARASVIESSFTNQINSENIKYDSGKLSQYADAKINDNIEISKEIDLNIEKLNNDLIEIEKEIKVSKISLSQTPDLIDVRKMQDKISKQLKQKVDIESKIIDDRAATQTGTQAIKKGEVVDESVIDSLSERFANKMKNDELKKATSKLKEVESEKVKLEKQLIKDNKINQLQKKIENDTNKKDYTEAEVKKISNNISDRLIKNIDTSKMGRRQISRIKKIIAQKLNHNTEIMPELKNATAKRLSDNNALLNDATSLIKKTLEDFDENILKSQKENTGLDIADIEKFYSKNNTDLMRDIKNSLLGKKVTDDIKTEFGYAKAEKVKREKIEKTNKSKLELEEKIELGKNRTSLLENIKALELKKKSINDVKKKSVEKKTELNNKSKGYKKAKDELEVTPFSKEALEAKLPTVYYDLLKDIEGKTDPDLVSLGVNYVPNRSLFGNGFKDIEVTVDTKIGGYTKTKFDNIEQNSNEYYESVGIDVDNINEEQLDFLNTNGSAEYKRKYPATEVIKPSPLDENLEKVNSDDGSFYSFLKFSNDWAKPFAESMSTDKNPIVANAGLFFLNSVTKLQGKLDNNDIGIALKREKDVAEAAMVNAFDTYRPIQNKLGIKANKEDLKENIGRYWQGDADNIKNSTNPRDILTIEVANNMKKVLDGISSRAKKSGHEKLVNWSENFQPKRMYSSGKINRMIAEISMDEIYRGVKESIIKTQTDIINKTTADGSLYVDVLAKTYTDILFKSKMGFNNVEHFNSSTQTIEDLVSFLEIQRINKDGSSAVDGTKDLNEILDHYKKRKDKKKSANKSKLALDEGHITMVKNKKGQVVEFQIANLLENNADVLARNTIEEATGRTILAERGITNREDFFDVEKAKARKWEEDNFKESGRSSNENTKRMDKINLDFDILRANLYGESDIKGVTPNMRTFQKVSNVFGNLSTAAQLDFAFLSYIVEGARAVAVSPVHNSMGLLKIAMNDIKGIKNGYRVLDEKTGQNVLVNPTRAMYERHFGSDRTIRSQAMNKNQTEFGGITEIEGADGKLDKAVYWSKKIANTMTGINSYVEGVNRRLAREGTIYELIKMAKDPEYKHTMFTKEGLESFKMSEDRFKSSMKVVNKYIRTVDGEAEINLDELKLDNPKEYGNIIELIDANIDQVVQRVNVGDKLFYETSQNPSVRIMGGILTKFRSFMLKAFGKDGVRLISYKDHERFAKQAFAMIIGQSIAYPLKVEKYAMQSENPEETREKSYSSKYIMQGMTAGISWAQAPLIGVETAVEGITGYSIFGAPISSRGEDASFITGNPMYSMGKSMLDVSSIALKSSGVKRGDVTKDEIDSITKAIPFTEFAKMTDFYKDFFEDISRYNDQTEKAEERRRIKQLSKF